MKGYSFGELVKLAEAALPKTDNAVSATKLQTARTIGGVSFDGTGNINLPGVNIAGTQNTSGRAAVASTADKLTTARNINGVAFDGTKNIDISAGAVGTYTKAEIDAKDNLKLDKTGGTVTGDLALTQTGPTPLRLTRTSGDNLNIQFTTGGNSFFFGLGVDGVFRVGNTNNLISTGNKVFHEGLPPTAAQVGLGNVNNTSDSAKNVLSATKLTTARTIAGVSFDGTSNISISAANVGAAPTSHTHTIANVTDLQNQLNYAQGLNVGASSADPNTTADHVILTNHANSPDASRYWHVTTTFYSSKTSGANRAQIAIIYNASGGVCRMYTRSYYSSTEWTPWAKVYTDKDKPTASDVGALAVGAKAADSDLLDGLDSTAFVRYGGGSYSQLLGKNASTSDWLRTTSNGLLPDANNTGSLGTSSWKFAQIHGVTIYENGTSLASKYLGVSANAASASKLSTARTIAGVSFDGTANINITAANVGALPASGKAADSSKLNGLDHTKWARADGRVVSDYNAQRTPGIYGVNGNGTNNPSNNSYGCLIVAANSDTGLQIAGGHSNDKLAFRGWSSSGSTWTAWRNVYHTGYKPTASDIGALATSGGALTGKLSFGTTSSGVSSGNPSLYGFEVYGATNSTTSYGLNLLAPGSGSTWGTNIYAANQADRWIYFSQKTGTAGTMADYTVRAKIDAGTGEIYANGDKRVYHAGNKPTAADVGALASNGTAVAATKLATPRAINGVNFDGSAAITITAAANGGTSAACSGNAATATKLATARTIAGVSFDGTANISIGATNVGTVPINGNSTAQNGFLNLIATNYALGQCLYKDVDFASGSNSVAIYNNTSGSGVTHTRESNSTAPNASKQVIKITHNPSAGTNPGYGGFITNMNSAANKIFVQVFVAKLDSGREWVTAENSMGTNAKTYWATSNKGTGKWERYIRVTMCGDSGSFSSGGHTYVTGGSSSTFYSYLAEATVYDVTNIALPFSRHNKPTATDVGALPSGGTAAAATKLATPRAINGVNFDGSANITITAAANGGNAATATTLQTARTINGVSFNGSANITITAAANGGTSAACSGNAATATKLATARSINGVNFDGTGNITITAAANGGTADKVNIKTSTLNAGVPVLVGWQNEVQDCSGKVVIHPTRGDLSIQGSYMGKGTGLTDVPTETTGYKAVTRVIGTTYTNSGNKMMAISAWTVGVGSDAYLQLFVNNTMVVYVRDDGSGGVLANLYGLIPPGAQYRLEGHSIDKCFEMQFS